MSDNVVEFEEKPVRGNCFLGMATLNVPKTLNSLSLEMVNLLRDQLEQWQTRKDIVAVFLEGSGDKAFCAGGDVRKLYDSMIECGQEKKNDYAYNFFEKEYRLDYLIHTYPKPIICWGNGIVMGGGIGLMSGASHRVVTESSRLAMPEITIGLYPDVGGTFFLNHAPGDSGLFLGITGANINAADALYVGLADRFIKHEHKAGVLEVLENVEWEYVNDAFGQVSRVLRVFEKQDREGCPESQVKPRMEIINQLCDGDTVGEIANNIVQFKTEDKWLSKAAKTLAAGCPTTAHIVYQQLKRGKHLSLKEVFQMELMVSVQCAKHLDFPEGVRALLVDKDGQPQWQHKNCYEVPEQYIEEHFTAPWGEEDHPLSDL